ncbi:MAG: class I SAM-dependent methyltransferase [Candidatus Methylumidiphilus sp.]
MDLMTIEAYDRTAYAITKLHANLTPTRLYQIAVEYFWPAKKSLDIGCGSGRDSAWLFAKGFDVIGIDASLGMLRQAASRYPQLTFSQAALPELSGIPDAAFYNALCSAVLMHVGREALPLAAKNILRVLVEGGVLLLSVRGTSAPDQRENGKLYETITPEDMTALFEQEGAELLLYESALEAGRNHLWHTFVFRK